MNMPLIKHFEEQFESRLKQDKMIKKTLTNFA